MYKLSQVLGIVGVTKGTIFEWERKGYIPEPERQSNGYRIYTEEMLEKIIYYKDNHTRPSPPHKRCFSKEQLEEMYYNKEMSLIQIAKELKTSCSVIASYMDTYEMPRRSISISMKMYSADNDNSFQDKKHTEETKKLLSNIAKGAGRFKGINNPMYGKSGPMAPNWKGGKSKDSALFWGSSEWKNLREEVFARDDYTCQECNDSSGGNLNAHHIKRRVDYPGLALDKNNCITLCESCHDKVSGKEIEFEQHFINVLIFQGKIKSDTL
jgi:hypothetical protein